MHLGLIALRNLRAEGAENHKTSTLIVSTVRVCGIAKLQAAKKKQRGRCTTRREEIGIERALLLQQQEIAVTRLW